jgi:hypothetical protein
MNESARNTRTLIVSFVFAIMALIPLRFIEVGQMVNSNVQVLGDQDVLVTLPNSGMELEAPYDEIEFSNQVLGDEVVETSCISPEDAGVLIAEYQDKLLNGGLDGEMTDQLVTELMAIESTTCR